MAINRQSRIPTNPILSPAQKQIINYLKKKDSTITEKTVPEILDGIKRFVKVVQKISSQPQIRIYIEEKKINGKIRKNKIKETTIEEFSKLKRGEKRDLLEAFRELDKITNE